MSFTSGLPPIDQSQLPADIRTASPERQKAYDAGLGFEQMLVQQLSQALTDSTAVDGGDAADGSDDGTTSSGGGLGGDSPYASLLPDALTQSVMQGGGLGLARQLADAVSPATSTSMSASAPADAAGGGAPA